MDQDVTSELRDQVRAAIEERRALCLRGSGSKRFLGRLPEGERLELAAHRGVLEYQPRELVIRARAATPLAEIETALAEQGQCLPFEPPHFGPGATLGGTIAAGLSGPARPYCGAARDLVLGTRILNGRAEVLRFGGEVMKNVAGYDVPRLMSGAFGTLGVLLDISLKVMPAPVARETRVFACDAPEALERLRRWALRPLPIDASCHYGERLWVRVSGSWRGVEAAGARLGGERLDAEAACALWQEIREQRHAFFATAQPLWRLSLPAETPALDLPGAQLIEWGGAQRWLRGSPDVQRLRTEIARLGGHVTLFRAADASARTGAVFQPLSPPLLALHRRLKQAFDPQGIFNPGRLFPDV